MAKLYTNSTFLLNKTWRFREEDASCILFCTDSGAILEYNETAAFIIKNIINGSIFEEIVKKICTRYDIDGEDAASDIVEFLDELISDGIIETIKE